MPTTLLSCLAAHASMLLFDGIERVPRPIKCSGVFAGVVADRDDPLGDRPARAGPGPALAGQRRARGGADRGRLPDRDRLRPVEAGWAVAARDRGDGLFVLCQGHPEYGTLSLLREYRRDVRRSLFGRGAVPYPRLPEGYLSARGGRRRSKRSSSGRRRRRATRASCGRASPTTRSRPASRTRWAAPSATLYAQLAAAGARGAAGPRRGLTPPMRDETLAIHGGYTPGLHPRRRRPDLPDGRARVHRRRPRRRDHGPRGARASTTTGSTTRRSTCSSSGSPRSRAARRRWRSAPARPRSACRCSTC